MKMLTFSQKEVVTIPILPSLISLPEYLEDRYRTLDSVSYAFYRLKGGVPI